MRRDEEANPGCVCREGAPLQEGLSCHGDIAAQENLAQPAGGRRDEATDWMSYRERGARECRHADAEPWDRSCLPGRANFVARVVSFRPVLPPPTGERGFKVLPHTRDLWLGGPHTQGSQEGLPQRALIPRIPCLAATPPKCGNLIGYFDARKIRRNQSMLVTRKVIHRNRRKQ